jgi:AcrR family transcriptional regulator
MPRRLQKLRARSQDEKLLRRATILGAARLLLTKTDWTELRMTDVARRAGMAKASVFRYFGKKEELILAVYLAELGAVFATLERELAVGRSLTAAEVARRLAATLVDHPLFVRLSTAVHAALARRITVASARQFKEELLGELAGAARLLEQRLPGLRPGTGLRLLLRFHAAMIGLWQLADPPPSVQAALEGGGLEAFRIDFAEEIEEVFVALLKNLEANP